MIGTPVNTQSMEGNTGVMLAPVQRVALICIKSVAGATHIEDPAPAACAPAGAGQPDFTCRPQDNDGGYEQLSTSHRAPHQAFD
jgi:hypothetical protein